MIPSKRYWKLPIPLDRARYRTRLRFENIFCLVKDYNRFVLRKDGTVRTVEIINSSGVMVLDRYIENAIRLASPFPPIPVSVGEDVIPISINFTYVLGGIRAFGFR